MDLMKRLSFDVLDALLKRSTEKMWDDEVTFDQHLVDYETLLEFAGWTEDELLAEIDRRWETTDRPCSTLDAFKC